MTSQKSPLILLCMDSAEQSFIKKWAEQGYLPTIASIMNKGFWGTTSGTEIMSEHGIWLSMMSGVPRSKHNYYYWRPLKTGTYDLIHADLRKVEAKPFWHLFKNNGKTIATIDIPEVYPVEDLDGIQLANWAPHNPRFEKLTVPSSMLKEIDDNFPLDEVVDEILNCSVDEDRKILRKLHNQLELKGKLCREILSKNKYDFIAFNFFECHVAGHQFATYSPEFPYSAKNQERGAGDLEHATREIYQALDKEFATLMSMLPDNTNVVIVSEIGIQADFPSQKLTEDFCIKLGYQVANTKSLNPMTIARRLVPERWRVAVSKNFPKSTREQLYTEQYRTKTDWSKTTAFSIPAFYTGMLRVNLRGREPRGIVNPGREYAELVDRLILDLEQLVEPVTDQRAVCNIWNASDLYDGDPPPELPDIIFEWTAVPFFRKRVVHPHCDIRQEQGEYIRDTHHTHIGFIAGAGPGIKNIGELDGIDILDMAPTFLHLMGEDTPDYMPGNILEAAK